MKMNYANIKKCDIANGLGIRVSLFVSGCSHHCQGCFNEEAWDFEFGKPFTLETVNELFEALDQPYVAGLTLLGGEPMEIVNQRALLPFLQKYHERYKDKNIWCYTGYLLDDLKKGGRAYCEVTDELLSYIDVLVDGPFVMSLKNITLKFRGSENQRVIDLKETLKSGHIVLFDDWI